MKRRLMYVDQNPEVKKGAIPEFLHNETDESITKETYKAAIKEAYKEGLKDAQKITSNTYHFEENKSGNHHGQQEAEKTHAATNELSKKRLANIIERHDIELLRAKSVFPFQLFPDTLIIDTTKVTIIEKTMIATESVSSCTLKDLSDVSVQTAFFLATLYIKYMPQSTSPGMNEPRVISINCLNRQDALKAKKILRGALVASAEKIDIASLPPKELADVLEKFGAGDDLN